MFPVADPETSEGGGGETWNISRRARRPSFFGLFLLGEGGGWPPCPPPWIRYWFLNVRILHNQFCLDILCFSCCKCTEDTKLYINNVSQGVQDPETFAECRFYYPYLVYLIYLPWSLFVTCTSLASRYLCKMKDEKTLFIKLFMNLS